MAYQTVELEHHHDGKVALIRLNRPDKLNSFNGQLIADLQDATSAVAADPAVRVVVLTGAGRGFSAGADLSDRGNSAFRDTEQALMEGYYPSIRNITTMPKPVIAAVNGPAAGAGSAFAMAPDLCVMADSAYVMLAFSNIALVPDCGATWLLSRAAGYRRAYEAAIEAQKVDAEECLRIGLANKVVPADQVLSTALDWAAKLSERAPRALALTKELMRGAATKGMDELFKDEAVRQNALIGSPDNAEGIQAFLEKRAPVFTGAVR